MEPFLGQMIMFGGNFAPRGWAFCEGQLLSISENTALFSLLGTIYGGDGRTTFALPDLRGRAPIHKGRGPGLSDRHQGAKLGSETNTISVDQMPAHSHAGTINAAPGDGDSNKATGNSLAHAARGGTSPNIYNSGTPSIAMHANALALQNTGSGQAVNNMQPSLAVNYIIALVGTFPSRS